MNSENFDLNNKENQDISLHGGLSAFARLALVVSSTFLGVLCGAWNLLGGASGYPDVMLMVAFMSWFMYFIVGGICAVLFLEARRLSFLPPIMTFFLVLGAFCLLKGAFSMTFVINALMSLLPFVLGFALAIAVKKGMNRTGAITVSATAAAVFALLVLMISALLSGTELSLSSLSDAVETVRLEAIEFFKLQIEAAVKNFPQYDFSEMDAETIVNGAFNILPAMSVLAFSVMAFFASVSMLALYRILGIYGKLKPSVTEFNVSAVTAVIFAVTYIASVFLSENDSAAFAVTYNLSTILMPALAVTGLMSMLPRRVGNSVRVGCFPLAICVPLLMFYTSLGILLLAIFGTVYTIRTEWRAAKEKK